MQFAELRDALRNELDVERVRRADAQRADQRIGAAAIMRTPSSTSRSARVALASSASPTSVMATRLLVRSNSARPVFLLHLPDLMRKRGLRDVQSRRCAREAALLGEDDEVA